MYGCSKVEVDMNIIGVIFPSVLPESSEEEVRRMSEELLQKIMTQNPDAVMCEGIFTLTFSTVTKLWHEGIKTLVACSKRESSEKKMSDGSVRRDSVFRFVRFREYGTTIKPTLNIFLTILILPYW